MITKEVSIVTEKQNSTFRYSREDRRYYWKGWEIESVGGFCTMRHFWASNEATGVKFWQFKLAEAKQDAYEIEHNPQHLDTIHPIHLKALYI